MQIAEFIKQQLIFQYDQVRVSPYKRSLDFSGFDLEDLKACHTQLNGSIDSLGIGELQEMILRGDLTCLQLAKYYLYRIYHYQAYNAVIELNTKILDQARCLDEKIRKKTMKSLYGVMVLLKDNIGESSLHTAAGAYSLREARTKRDAFIVTCLKDQDALILGKANLSEWSNFFSSPSSNGFSVLGGQTLNPHGRYDVGGSSSGPCVAASLNLATVTLGTETCGSLIYPAGQNSVVTIKASLGLHSRDLIIPISEAMDMAGVIGRTVEDTYRVFKHLVKEDVQDRRTQVTKDLVIKDKLGASKARRIGYLRDDLSHYREVLEEFDKLGIEAVEIELGSIDGVNLMPILNHGIVHDLNAYLSSADVDSPFKSIEELVDFYKANPQYMPYGQDLFTGALDQAQPVDKILDHIRVNQEICQGVIDQALASYDVDMILVQSNRAFLYATAGYPAISLPAGKKSNGEPYNLTLLSGFLKDISLFEFAKSYEDKYDHRMLPQVNL